MHRSFQTATPACAAGRRLTPEEFEHELLRPAYGALHSRSFARAAELQRQALAAMQHAAFELADRECFAVKLQLLGLHIRWASDEASWNDASYRAARRMFECPVRTAAGNHERLKQLIVIRINAETDGLEELPRAELDGLLAQFGSDASDVSLWHNIAGWAFRHDQLDLLERAYELLLTSPHNHLGSARWQRVNLMYLLLSGRAGRRDIVESIARLLLPPQLREFTQLLWPACQAAGLVDSELQALLEARAQQIYSQNAAD